MGRIKREKIKIWDIPKTSNRRTLVDILAEIDYQAHEYHTKYLKALKTQHEIELFIGSLTNPLHRNILRLKYLDGRDWREVAEMLNFKSVSHLKEQRNKSLAKSEIRDDTGRQDVI